jgi:diacylglycerol O-acyltransferase / wax synthase
MERLSPLDASFLYLEGPRTPMHISSLAVYEGPAPAEGELRDALERKLPLLPRFRQRLATVPFGGHRPVWIDDEAFDLDAHLEHVALPRPTDSALTQLAGRIFAQPLCRTRPLWEMWMITGLAQGRFAILSKTHHSLWDGITGVDLHSVLLDASPDTPMDAPVEPFEPEPEPNGVGLFAAGIADRAREAAETARGAIDTVRDPGRAWRNVTTFARDAASFASSFIRPAPPSALNSRTGSRRRYALAHGSLHEVKDLKHTLGASVNDVVLAAVAGAIRQWQIHRGETPSDVRAMVPVSVRNDEDGLGNRVAMVVVDLPVTDRTSLVRLDRVHFAMKRAKTSGHVAAGDALTRLSGLMPPIGIAAMSRVQAMARPFNVLVTNIPGPTEPLYLLGRKLIELYPQAPLAANQGLSIAALSYNGKIGFGLLADHDSMPDVNVLARALESSLDELCYAGGLDSPVPAEPSLSQLAELVSVT